MIKKSALIILVLLAVLLSACESPQSTPSIPPTKSKPQASATVDPNAPLDPMEDLSVFGTQTAVALAGGDPMDFPPLDDGLATITPESGGEQPTVDPLLAAPTSDAPVLATVTPQPVAKPGTYTLQKGEFIFCLARRFDVDVNQTLKINGLFDSETLQPGLTVKIPAGGKFSGVRALKAHPATYTVKAQDTIYSIACLYGDVDPMNIAAVNGLAAPYTLTPGAQIQIP